MAVAQINILFAFRGDHLKIFVAVLVHFDYYLDGTVTGGKTAVDVSQFDRIVVVFVVFVVLVFVVAHLVSSGVSV